MKSVWKCLVQSTVAVCVSAGLATIVSAQDAGQEGIVRISKPARSASNTQVLPVNAMMMDNCAPGSGAGMSAPGAGGAAGAMNGLPCPQGGSGGMGCPTPNGFGAGMNGAGMYGDGFSNSCPVGPDGYPLCNRHPHCGNMLEYLKCKFGYFIPTGGGGQGIPWVGHYARVYPVNPYYRDSRDGQMWAAQGYGLPMGVPLAPVVGHTYDYSWGVPSSRLTPVSNPAY